MKKTHLNSWKTRIWLSMHSHCRQCRGRHWSSCCTSTGVLLLLQLTLLPPFFETPGRQSTHRLTRKLLCSLQVRVRKYTQRALWHVTSITTRSRSATVRQRSKRNQNSCVGELAAFAFRENTAQPFSFELFSRAKARPSIVYSTLRRCSKILLHFGCNFRIRVGMAFNHGVVLTGQWLRSDLITQSLFTIHI